MKKTKRILNYANLDFLASFNSVERYKKEILEDTELQEGKGVFWKDTSKTSTGIYAWCHVDNLTDKVMKELEKFRGKI